MTGRVMNLNSGAGAEGIEGTGKSYELILEELEFFDILEGFQLSPDQGLYEKSCSFIEEYLTVVD